MKDMFINDDFMLTNDYASELYHCSAELQPIIDYHCHLNPKMIAENYQFEDLTHLWLSGDHYKWRAMRGNGVPEEYITGGADSYSKFEKWAETVPYTMRNPLYHWTHLELVRVFGIDEILNPQTAGYIYEKTREMLGLPEFSAQGLMRKFNLEAVCTTDDPVDSLEWHKKIRENHFGVKVLPTWRPDKALAVEDPAAYVRYIGSLSEVSGIQVVSYESLLDALRVRHDFFALNGCRISDHGLDTFYADDYTTDEVEAIFKTVLAGKMLSQDQILKFKSALLFDLAVMDHEKDWVQQFHIGPIRNNNRKMFSLLGPDTGFDAINDCPCAVAGHRFFSRLAEQDSLAKTILYNLNPKDTEVLLTMAYTFNDSHIPGKMQYGSAWWFLDQEDGMRRQINALSSMGLLSRFVGMLTDSRSFISYPRHEYFRRILCDIIGKDLKDGKLPVSEMDFIRKMVADICYGNAKNYFNL